MFGTPKSAKGRGKKTIWGDWDESYGSSSMPSTPTSKTQFRHELGLVGQYNNTNNNEKRSIIEKMQGTVKKWKAPSFRKKNWQKVSKLGIESSKSTCPQIDNPNQEEYEEEDPEYHGAPMYESESAPDIYKKGSTQLQSLMNPPNLLRCKSQRPRPGYKSRLEEIADMNRTKSDPLQLESTKSETEQIHNINRSISDPLNLNPTFTPNPAQHNNNSNNTERRKSLLEEYCSLLEPANNPNCSDPSSNIDNNNDSNESNMPKLVTKTASPTSKVLSETALMIADSAPRETKPESYPLNQTTNNSLSISAPTETHGPVTQRHISPSLLDSSTTSNDRNMANCNEKTVSEAIDEILTPAFNVAIELNKPVDPTPIMPDNIKPGSVGLDEVYASVSNPITNDSTANLIKHEPPKSIISEPATTNDNNFKLVHDASSVVATEIKEWVRFDSKSVSSNESDDDMKNNSMNVELGTNKSEIVDDAISEKKESSKLESITVSQNETGDASNDTNESDDNMKDNSMNVELGTNKSEIVDDAISEKKESSKLESITVSQNETGDASNDTNDDYKTVVDAVGEIMSPVYSKISPVYSKISDLTNKVSVAGYSKGLSIRDYLKNKRVVDQVRDTVSSLLRQEDQDNQVPVSTNPHAVEETNVDGRRLQENTN